VARILFIGIRDILLSNKPRYECGSDSETGESGEDPRRDIHVSIEQRESGLDAGQKASQDHQADAPRTAENPAPIRDEFHGRLQIVDEVRKERHARGGGASGIVSEFPVERSRQRSRLTVAFVLRYKTVTKCFH
jgi:hypothetical protein